MATNNPVAYAALMAALADADWASVLDAVSAAGAWLRDATPGESRIDSVVARLVLLSDHPKWEIRRAVANAAAQVLHPEFESAVAKLATDDNARVRQAAEHAALRRRDWQNASTLGKQHEDRINSTLDDIEVRFGRRGRDAVKRASEQIADTFARELYHEVIRLLTPLASSADRLRTRISEGRATRAELAKEAARIESRVAHLRAVLDAMRAYTAQPKVTFAMESLREVIDEAVSPIRDGGSNKERQPPIEIHIEAALSAEVSRPRLVQALTNVLANAVESYDALEGMKPIVVRAVADEGRVVVSIQDSGCGMTDEAAADARVLFVTNKEGGTGFGLPLAIKIVESEHAGRLIVESTKGHGTIVTLIIPVQQQRTQG